MCGACYERHRLRQVAYGRWDSQRVAAQPIRDHITTLLNAGMSRRVIADAAGTSHSKILVLFNGRSDRSSAPPSFILRATADRYLNVPIPSAARDVALDGALVSSVGARRRVQALVAAGWTLTALGEQISGDITSALTRDRITARRHRQIAGLFTRLQLIPGPSDRARRYAARRRWPLPLEWDEDEIDDPDASPTSARHTSASSRVERIDQTRELTDAGLSAQEIADRLDVDRRTIVRYRAESLMKTA